MTPSDAELYRELLKPGGMAILQIHKLKESDFFADDTLQIKNAKIFGQYDHVRIYGRDYFDKLRSIGFTVVEEDYTNKYPRLLKNIVWPKGDYSGLF
jgi:hypothetical protein